MIHRKWTPVELTVLLACHYNGEFNNGLPEAPSYNKALQMWTSMGYIYPFHEDGLHCTTDRGQLMVDVLCSTSLFLPLP
jgi:hypothetical protein